MKPLISQPHFSHPCPLHQETDASCPFCMGEKNYYLNHLNQSHPLLIRYWHPDKNHTLTPYESTAQSKHSIWWKCPSCHHEWKAPICQMANDEVHCPSCRG